MTYSEKLKDPRWQKKRLEILKRDNWTCQNCQSTTKTLHVHHLKYNGNPWEANNNDLQTLCEDCHEQETIKAIDIKLLAKKISLPQKLSKPEPDKNVKVFARYQFDVGERQIVKLMLEYGDKHIGEDSIIKLMVDNLSGIHFENLLLNKILQEYIKGIETKNIPDQQHFINHPDKEISDLVVELIYSPYTMNQNWYKLHDIVVSGNTNDLRHDLLSSMALFKFNHVMRRIDGIMLLVRKSNDEIEIDKYIAEINEYQKIRKSLAEELGMKPVLR